MENFTQSMSPSTTDSIVSSQSHKISANLSLSPSLALSLPTRTSQTEELTSQGDFLTSSFSMYLDENASSLTSKSLTFFP